MKNLQAVVEKEDIRAFVGGLWKTDLFREQHATEGSFVWRAVERFSWLPRFFAEATNDHIERSHFSTWWGVIMLRDDYDNPFIHDLYLLHEFYHAAHMSYIPGIGKVAFDEKMQRNELEASVMSEIQVYFEMPELRALSFDHVIYADRFLKNANMQALWASNRDVAIETIRTVRRDVMLSKPEHLMDITERWIRRFAEQNAIYSITWSDRYLEVEERMYAFQIEASHSRARAAENHTHWLVTEAAKDEIDNIPFRQEGELFATFYWANKEKYSKAMKEAA
jgi:hypothetical protein